GASHLRARARSSGPVRRILALLRLSAACAGDPPPPPASTATAGGDPPNRLALLAALALGSPALAQEAGGYSAGPGLGSPDYQTTVNAPRVKSPVYTQDRVFGATRFWKLDPGRFEVEVWWDEKFKRDEPNESVLKLEL